MIKVLSHRIRRRAVRRGAVPCRGVKERWDDCGGSVDGDERSGRVGGQLGADGGRANGVRLN